MTAPTCALAHAGLELRQVACRPGRARSTAASKRWRSTSGPLCTAKCFAVAASWILRRRRRVLRPLHALDERHAQPRRSGTDPRRRSPARAPSAGRGRCSRWARRTSAPGSARASPRRAIVVLGARLVGDRGRHALQQRLVERRREPDRLREHGGDAGARRRRAAPRSTSRTRGRRGAGWPAPR